MEGVFSQEARPLEEEEAAWVALRSGGEDSSPASDSVASPGSCSSVWCGGEKGPGGLVGLAGFGVSYMDISYKQGLGWTPGEPLLQLSFPTLPIEWVGVWLPLDVSVLTELPMEWP